MCNRKQKSNNMKNRFCKVVLTLFVAGCMVSCGGSSGKKATTTKKEAEKVKVQVLQSERIARELELSTTLEGYESMNVAPSITGRIEHIYVEVGSRVGKGTLLVRMDQTHTTS